MKKSLLSISAASALLVSSGFALAQTTTTTTTWTNDQGSAIREYSTTQHYTSYNDTSMNPAVGAELPATVELHPLPSTVTVQNPDQYSYTIVNNQPVVVERTTRRVVHTWMGP